MAFGVNGVEYFGHPWEFGIRKAKEMLFTGRAITAKTAKDIGMVNRVVPDDELADATLELAKEIAEQTHDGSENREGIRESHAECAGFVRLVTRRDDAAAAVARQQQRSARTRSRAGRRGKRCAI